MPSPFCCCMCYITRKLACVGGVVCRCNPQVYDSTKACWGLLVGSADPWKMILVEHWPVVAVVNIFALLRMPRGVAGDTAGACCWLSLGFICMCFLVCVCVLGGIAPLEGRFWSPAPMSQVPRSKLYSVMR